MAEMQIADIWNAADAYGVQSFSVADAGPAHLTFVSDVEGEVMRITANGVFVNPAVSADFAAQVVVAALDQHIKHLVSDKDAEIARLRAELAKKEPE